ncbi:Uu.00g023200.m01.CDS01 [Anthostomella pinea]|uniref:Uu.00g023200.m01.CDS01 n=1 Tax=Anthostomella pinea TaxID=933095 RepID=A0AAI8VU54_9PEZI|nr:Uu.00g023200.m01.CDS01 [Anthostomella pinea]
MTQILARDPIAVSLWHFNVTIQYYSRAARIPRVTVRAQEQKAHEDVNHMELRLLQFALDSLNQDQIQMSFLLDTISRIRTQHRLLYSLLKDADPHRV